MKNRVFVSITLLLVLLMTACQPTPESQIVKNKDQGQLIDKASDTNNMSSSLEDRADAKGEFKLEPKSYGTLKIQADAKIFMPDAKKLPIVRVEAADFSQEQITAYFDYFCSGLEMYKERSQTIKSDIEFQILRNKELIAATMGEDKKFEENMLAQIERLEEAYAAAPESIPDERSDGTIYQMEIQSPGSSEYDQRVVGHRPGLAIYEKLQNGEKGMSFRVNNKSDINEVLILHKDENGRPTGIMTEAIGASIWISRPTALYQHSLQDMMSVSEKYVPDEQISKNLKITAAEAKAKVQDMLDETKTPMKIMEIGVIEIEIDGKLEYGYKFICKRVVENVPCAEIVVEDNGLNTQPEEDVSLRLPWEYERCYIQVRNDGITSVQWVSPMNVIDTVVDDSNIKSFAEIESTFEKMMSVKYEFESKNEYITGLNYNINKVELEMVRILEQDSQTSVETGLLVPAWRFYGTREVLYKQYESGEMPEPQRTYGCWLTLNAIDGALIDEKQGY